MSAYAGPVPLVRLRFGAATDPGRIRAGNEDAVAADPALGVFGVADGVGGHRAGEVASRLAAETFLASVRAAAGGASDNRKAVISQAVTGAHQAVRAAAQQPGQQGMAAIQVSVDHCAVEGLRRVGLLPDDPADWPPRAELTQAVGLSEPLTHHAGCCQLMPGDRVLLCSDGLTGMLADAEISQVLTL